MLYMDIEGKKAKYKILIAEDNLLNQKLLTLLLKKNDLDFVTARKGTEVVDKFKTEKPDLILMDIWMPELDGFEATAEIRILEKDTEDKVPIIAVTGHSSPDEIELINSSGMNDYILKPFDFNKLLEKIKNQLKKK